MFRRREEQPAGEFAAGHFFWALGSLAQLFRIPFAASLVAQAFPPPYDIVKLQGGAGDRKSVV